MALGMIEVFGFATSIVVADAMAKAADVEVVAVAAVFEPNDALISFSIHVPDTAAINEPFWKPAAISSLLPTINVPSL